MELTSLVLILGGVVLLLGGLWWLWGGSIGIARPGAGLSEPTRLAIGVVHLLLGYHLVAWALPERVVSLQLPRRAWPWVVGGAAGAIAASVAIDRLEASVDARAKDEDRQA